MAVVNSSRRLFLHDVEHDNPFSQDGELSKKADFIIQNSSFDLKNLKVVDPDLEGGVGDNSYDPRFIDSSYQETDTIQDKSFPVISKKVEMEESLTAEEVEIKRKRGIMKCCSLQ